MAKTGLGATLTTTVVDTETTHPDEQQFLLQLQAIGSEMG